jgi:hypothetical protein
MAGCSSRSDCRIRRNSTGPTASRATHAVVELEVEAIGGLVVEGIGSLLAPIVHRRLIAVGIATLRSRIFEDDVGHLSCQRVERDITEIARLRGSTLFLFLFLADRRNQLELDPFTFRGSQSNQTRRIVHSAVGLDEV